MQDLGLWLQIATIVLLTIWRFYWHITEKHAEMDKPRKQENIPLFHKKNLSKFLIIGAFILVAVQLFGLEILPFPSENPSMQMVGFLIVFAGWSLSMKGRYDLGTNWEKCYDYQVKNEQELVTSGVYKYVRHPIYSGIALMFIGGELIVQSYLVFAYLLLYYAAYMQAKWEEALLIKHFGNKYKEYMKRSKRFIPFVI
jgi:protein-S-isoprenylcysteine O-methyltransferase Ste14